MCCFCSLLLLLVNAIVQVIRHAVTLLCGVAHVLVSDY